MVRQPADRRRSHRLVRLLLLRTGGTQGQVSERRRLIDLDTVDKYSYDESDFVRQVQTARSEVQQDFVRVYHPETHRSKKFPVVWAAGSKPQDPDVLEELSADLHRHFKRYEPDFDAIATAFTARTAMALPHMVGWVAFLLPGTC